MKRKLSSGVTLFVIALIFTIGSAALIIFAVRELKHIDQILMIICGILLFGISILIWYILSLSLGKKHNFFLYNTKSKKYITVKELTNDIIEEKLGIYFGVYITSLKNDPINRFINTHFDGEMPEVYRPLLIPFLFLVQVKYGEIESWISFSRMEKEWIDHVENALFALGAKKISNKLQYYRG